jgi:hypothetical protein
LLAGSKNELGAAVDTCQNSIGEFHGQLASQGITPTSITARSGTCRSRFPVLFQVAQQGPGPRQKLAVFKLLPGIQGSVEAARYVRAERQFTFLWFLQGFSKTRRGSWGGDEPPIRESSARQKLENRYKVLRRRVVPFLSSSCDWRLSFVSLESPRNGQSRGG